MKAIILKTSGIVTLAALAYLGLEPLKHNAKSFITNKKEQLLEKLTTVKVVKEYVQPAELPTEEMINRISLSMGINPIITHAIARQESGLSYKADALRYEPHLESRFANQARTAEERRMLATSIGVMQVIPGFHIKTCGLSSYADLFDKRVNITCGLKVLKSCLDYNAKEAKTSARFRRAFVCYNGDEKYADAIFNHIGQIVLESGLEG